MGKELQKPEKSRQRETRCRIKIIADTALILTSSQYLCTKTTAEKVGGSEIAVSEKQD